MKTKELLFGAAYYDEYMPYDRIETDMQMMVKAGMNVIRIAESTWSTIEPQEGVFDFTHLDRMLAAAEKYNLKVIIGTPTYAIPTWLVKKSEDILTVTKNGKSLYGHRQNMDITSPIYLQYAAHVIRTMMEHIKDHPSIIGYQLDNETKAYGTAGERVQKRFVEYIRLAFNNDLDAFNQEFGLDYWSNRINNWDDFPNVLGTINGSLAAEFEKFQRTLVRDFLSWQSSIINEYKHPEQFITHNFDFGWTDYSYGLQPEVNQFETAQCMDVAGCDIYHPSQDDLTGAEITFCGSIARGMKKNNYLVLETEAQGNLEWLPYPGQLRLQAFSHLANGANSVMYWHWHSIHNAIESYWKGVLSHDLGENATYREAATIGADFQRIGSHLVNLKKKNKAAIMVSNESLTGMKQFPLKDRGDQSYNTVLRWLADSLYRLNVEYDIIWDQDTAALKKYDLVLIPALYSASEDTLNAISDYVKAGGHIVTTFKSGFSNEHIKIYSDKQPHFLKECCGVSYDQFTYPKNVTLKNCVLPYSGTATVTDWMELLMPTTALTLCTYDHPFWNQYAAVTYNQFGCGSAAYLGCMFNEDALDAIMEYILHAIDFKHDKLRFPVIVHTGTNEFGKQITYYMNYSGTKQSFTYHGKDGVSLFDDATIDHAAKISLRPWEFTIIES